MSKTNEVACLRALRDAALVSLAQFETTIEQDDALLAAAETDPTHACRDSNIRNCVVVRRGEKQVLQWFVQLHDTCVPYLQMSYRV